MVFFFGRSNHPFNPLDFHTLDYKYGKAIIELIAQTAFNRKL